MVSREINTRPIVKICGWLLFFHGIFCLFGAFFPVHPVIFLFYWFFPAPFLVSLVIVLAGGAAQVIFGVYLAFRARMRRVGWYWLVLIGVVIVLALLVYPILNEFSGF
jgi:VIT1/CCC1 family predicted Fe2+/Mn2+ transporter